MRTAWRAAPGSWRAGPPQRGRPSALADGGGGQAGTDGPRRGSCPHVGSQRPPRVAEGSAGDCTFSRFGCGFLRVLGAAPPCAPPPPPATGHPRAEPSHSFLLRTGLTLGRAVAKETSVPTTHVCSSETAAWDPLPVPSVPLPRSGASLRRAGRTPALTARAVPHLAPRSAAASAGLRFLPLPPAACRARVVLVAWAPSRAAGQGCAQRNPHLAAQCLSLFLCVLF